MFVIKARELLAMTSAELWKLPNSEMQVVFDDGVLATNGKATKLSWYFWPFFRLDPEVPLKMEHHIGNGGFTKDLQLKQLARCLFDVYLYRPHQLQQHPVANIEVFSKMAYDAINALFNDMTYMLEEYVVSISAEDYVDLMDHPEIARINRNLKSDFESIESAYREIYQILKDPLELPDNRIACAVRAGIVSAGQVMQSICAVGYRTGVDSHRFPDPVMSNFGEGITELYESLVESRSASKAQMNTHKPLQDTQYYNREMQLVTCSLERMTHFTDCGTTRTLPFAIRNSHDLQVLDGKWSVDETGNKTLIRASHRHLIGKVVNMRSVTTCDRVGEDEVCSTCFGEIFHSVPDGTNIGHMSVVEICERISQIVLSTKHLDMNAKIEEFVVNDFDAKYITIDGQEGCFKLKPWLRDHSPSLLVAIDALPGIAMLTLVSDLSALAPDSVGEFPSVSIKHDNRLGDTTIPLCVGMGSRKSHFTHDFLRYLANTRRDTTVDRFYEIPLSGWDFEKPFLQLPAKHRNMLEFKDSIEKFIKAGDGHKERLYRPLTEADIAATLVEFHDLVSTKLTINIVHLEVVLAATMIRSSAAKDFRLPSKGTGCEFAAYGDLIRMRSLAPALAYETQVKVLCSLDSYQVKERPYTSLDPVLY